MDLDKLISVATEYASDYIAVLILTLRDPVSRFDPVAFPADPARTPLGATLNPRLVVFMLLSLFVGSALAAATPGSKGSVEFANTAIQTMALWLAYSLSVHLVCKLLGGRASLIETLSVSLQLLAVLYVVSSFFTFMWALLAASGLLAGGTAYPLLRVVIERPPVFYFLVQFLLVAVYLPLAVRRVHSLGPRAAAVLIVPLIWTLFLLNVYIGSGGDIITPVFPLR